MTAGLNLKGRIWRLIANPYDDSVGGAVPSGTILYEPIFARIFAERPTLALLEQGLEVPTIFRGQLSYPVLTTGTFNIQPNDQLEITFPPISPYYQKKFVLIGIQPPSFEDGRHYVQVNLRRLVIANSNNLQ